MQMPSIAPAGSCRGAIPLAGAVDRSARRGAARHVGQPTRSATVLDSSLWAAQSFFTAGDAVLLDSIDVSRRPGDRPDGTSPNCVHADGAGLPWHPAHDLQPVRRLPRAPQVERLTPAPRQLPLAAATGYWLVLRVANNSGGFGFSYAEVARPAPVRGIASAPDALFDRPRLELGQRASARPA